MIQTQPQNSLNRIFKTSLILIGIGTFTIITFGLAMINTSNENKRIRNFLEIAKTAQPNFETSLTLYTERTQYIIDYLLKLRPENEEQFVDFIAKIEEIAQNLSLNINIQSYSNLAKAKDEKSENGMENETINYQITFFGGINDLNNLLSQMEDLPYFIKIESMEYKDPNYIEKDEKTPPNINIRMKLYIKQS